MSLKNVVETLDDIPEALHEHYAEKDDNFVLVHDANDAVDQFRANNVALREKVEGLETKLKTFDGMDADKYKELESLERQKRDKELIDSGDVETLINEKIDVQKSEYEKRLDAVNVELSNVRGELVATKVTDQLKSAAASAGVRSDALNDVVVIASGDWELREGAAVRVQNNEVVLSVKNAGEPMTMGEYFDGMVTEKPFFFNGSSGAGGQESKNAGGGRGIANDPMLIGQYAADIAAGKVVVEGQA